MTYVNLSKRPNVLCVPCHYIICLLFLLNFYTLFVANPAIKCFLLRKGKYFSGFTPLLGFCSYKLTPFFVCAWKSISSV